MIKSKTEEQAIALIEQGLNSTEFELVDVSVVGPRSHPTLRVYVGKINDSISIDEVVQATKLVDSLLEEVDLFTDGFTLEVSSPGIDRPLRTPDHYRRFAGQTVDIKRTPKDGRKTHYVGKIGKVAAQSVIIETEDGPVEFEFDEITRSRLVGKVSFNNTEKEH